MLADCPPNTTPIRAGWVVTQDPVTYEDQLPSHIYVSYPATATIIRLDILAFEYVSDTDEPFWQVTYRACLPTD